MDLRDNNIITKRFIIILVSVVTLAVLLNTQISYALFDIVDDLNNWLKDLLLEFVEVLLQGFAKVMQSISAADILTSGFELLLGSGASTGFYDILYGLHQTMIIPLAHSILALVMLVQVVKISQRIDATSSLPAVKDIVILTVFFVFFTFLINNSLELCGAVYNDINSMALYLTGTSSISTTLTLNRPSDLTNVSYGVILMYLLFVIIAFLIGLLAWVISYLMAYARAFQVYIMATFSPVPFALMGYEGTRSFGIGFCKNFIAVCLAGIIMILMLIAFPFMMNSLVSDSIALSVTGSIQNQIAAMGAPIRMLAVSVLLAFGLTKSGAWARDILGG